MVPWMMPLLLGVVLLTARGQRAAVMGTQPNHALEPTANSLVSLRGDVGESPSRRTRT